MKEKKIDILVANGYIPVANVDDLNNIKLGKSNIFGKGTKWEGLYKGGLDASYIQVNDINMAEYIRENIFEPIGEHNGKAFKGEYNGGQFTIKNLEIVRPKKFGIGLFGKIKNSSIINTNIHSTNTIHGNSHVGGLVGQATSSVIKNCSVVMRKTLGKMNTGGIVGFADNTRVENCTTKTVFNLYFSSITGGIVGFSKESIVNNCTATIRVDGPGAKNAGGIVGGSAGSTIMDSESFSSIKGDNIGGIIGHSLDSEVESCLTDSILEGNNIGGVIGVSDNSAIITSLCKDNYGEIVSIVSKGSCRIRDSFIVAN